MIVAAYLGHSHVVDSLIEAARTSTRRTTTGPLRSTLLPMKTTPPSSVFSLLRGGLACEGHLGGRPSRVCAQEWAPGGCGDLSVMSTFFFSCDTKQGETGAGAVRHRILTMFRVAGTCGLVSFNHNVFTRLQHTFWKTPFPSCDGRKRCVCAFINTTHLQTMVRTLAQASLVRFFFVVWRCALAPSETDVSPLLGWLL